MKTANTTKQTVLVLGGTGKPAAGWQHNSKKRAGPCVSDHGLPVLLSTGKIHPLWEPALQDIEAVYLSYHPDLAIPGAVDTVRSFTQTAVKNGIKKIVLLSGRGEKEAQACEQIIMNSRTSWTILRCAWFSQNFSEGYL